MSFSVDKWCLDLLTHAAWLDGVPEPSARVGTSGVTGLSDRRRLAWQASRTLVDRSVGDRVAEAAPALAARLAGRLARLREHKQVSASELTNGDGRVLDRGWSIHEEVTW